MAAVGKDAASARLSPLSCLRIMLVPTWCQTTLIQADIRAPIMTASPALIGLMARHGCPQVGDQADTSSWECGHGLMVPLCSRNAHDEAGLVRRAQWGNHLAHDLKEGGRSHNARPEKALVGRAQLRAEPPQPIV